MLPAPWKHIQSCQPQGRKEGKGRQGLCQTHQAMRLVLLEASRLHER